MIKLELSSAERWILATAVSRQIGVYSEKLKSNEYRRKSKKYNKKERKNLRRLESILSVILINLQGDGAK